MRKFPKRYELDEPVFLIGTVGAGTESPIDVGVARDGIAIGDAENSTVIILPLFEAADLIVFVQSAMKVHARRKVRSRPRRKAR